MNKKYWIVCLVILLLGSLVSNLIVYKKFTTVKRDKEILANKWSQQVLQLEQYDFHKKEACDLLYEGDTEYAIKLCKENADPSFLVFASTVQVLFVLYNELDPELKKFFREHIVEDMLNKENYNGI